MSELSWITALGLASLTLSSGMSVYSSNGDAGSILFIAVTYLDLAALFACLRLYVLLDRHSPHRKKVEAAIYALTILLNALFSYKVAVVIPFAAVKVVLWAMAAAHACGAFCACFITFFIDDDKEYQQQQDVAAAAERGEGAKY